MNVIEHLLFLGKILHNFLRKTEMKNSIFIWMLSWSS